MLMLKLENQKNPFPAKQRKFVKEAYQLQIIFESDFDVA